MPRRINRPNSPYPRYLNQISTLHTQSDDDYYRESSPDFENEINQSNYILENYPDTYEQYQDVDHVDGQDVDRDEEYYSETFDQDHDFNHYQDRTTSHSDDEDYGPYNDYAAAEPRDRGHDAYPRNNYVDSEDGFNDEEQYSYDDYVDDTQHFHNMIHQRHDTFEASDPNQDPHFSDNELEDYPNYSHGSTYPAEHYHTADKPIYYHEDSNQEYHYNCHICSNYLEDFYKRGYQNDTDSDDEANNYY